jgi:phosphoribosylanthranilate isomerase
MKPRVKICGITNREDALFCAHSGADALGFIFFPESPRFIESVKAKSIIDSLPPFITPVGVFVNERRERIEQIIRETGIRAIQLSGDEKPEDCMHFSVRVIKAFRFKTHDELHQLKKFQISAAMLDGAKDGLYGGTGMKADFSIAIEVKKHFPLVLSGGLSPNNIIDAIETVTPYAVDLNSGVERLPGIKDHGKIASLFHRIALIGKE